ncbi:MAG: hypothetical protein M3Z36_13665 [Acidobacteriota bacterium]|nr:hypothetical protein [Acidobacteriota bacterium]
MAVYNQNEIDDLIECPKNIFEAPKRAMKLVGADWRNDMRLVSCDEPILDFSVFMRKNEDFPENFSVGLKYHPKDDRGEIILLRCNGPHGGYNASFDPDHPHWAYHVHRADEKAIDAGLKAEKYARITTAYASFEEALRYFVREINLNATDVSRYFPKLTLIDLALE